MNKAVWAIVRSPAKTGWYHVGRIIFVDGEWYELYWLYPEFCGPNKATIRAQAESTGTTLETGVFYSISGKMNKLERKT